MRKLALGLTMLVSLMTATATFAAPPACPAPAATGQLEVPFLAPLTPAPESVITYPAPGSALYDATYTPNCTWTCRTGARGGKNVASELDCQSACAAACHNGCWMV
jgi:hypothetical protein